jgi:hypothetical protein
LSTNLALPGFGSIMGKRIVGYFQAPFCVLGAVLTVTFAARFAVWYFTNRARLNNADGDPWEVLSEIWINVRWSLAGMAIFALDWLWALATSYSLLNEAKRQERAVRAERPPQLAEPAGEAPQTDPNS